MGWNGIGIGWPNASAYSGPPNPEFTRYIVADCVIDGNQYYTTNYGYNDFQINDRCIVLDVDNNYAFVIPDDTKLLQE